MTNGLSSKLIYPNPFQPTGIEFELPTEAIVTVTIIDEAGREVETLEEREQCSAGKHVIPIDLAKYAAGQYWYQITLTIGERNLVETRQLQ